MSNKNAKKIQFFPSSSSSNNAAKKHKLNKIRMTNKYDSLTAYEFLY